MGEEAGLTEPRWLEEVGRGRAEGTARSQGTSQCSWTRDASSLQEVGMSPGVARSRSARLRTKIRWAPHQTADFHKAHAGTKNRTQRVETWSRCRPVLASPLMPKREHRVARRWGQLCRVLKSRRGGKAAPTLRT